MENIEQRSYTEIQQEIFGIEIDKKISSQERLQTLAILKAELKRTSFDSKIKEMKSKLNTLKEEIVSLIVPYLTYMDEEKVNMAKELLSKISSNSISFYSLINISKKDAYESVYLDSKIDEKLHEAYDLETQYYESVQRKYYSIISDLTPIINSDLINVVNESGEFKPSEEIEENFASLDSIISSLNVASEYKKILSSILNDIKSYGISNIKMFYPYEIVSSESMENISTR